MKKFIVPEMELIAVDTISTGASVDGSVDDIPCDESLGDPEL